MASNRKKQEDKNLKTLRELVTSQGNRQCFDCNQRGPTYVNMTIGSFVCTRCSGILRGLTPPHRVKSISMATFTSEEIEQIRLKGNEKCAATWMGLCQNTNNIPELKEEHQLKEYLSDKYEKKRFYIEENAVKSPTNGILISNNESKPVERPKETDNFFSTDFEADFSSADIFNSVQTTPTHNNCKQNNQNNNVNGQMSFANFDNNAIFNAATLTQSTSSSLNNLKNFNDSFNGHTDAFGCSQSFNNIKSVNQQQPQPTFQTNFPVINNGISPLNTLNMNNPPPPEDKYAALKELELAMKNEQNKQEVSSSNGIWNSPKEVQSNRPWESEFNHSAFDPKSSTVTNPFSLKQTSVQNIWTSPQSAVENVNPFKVELTNKMNHNMNNANTQNLFDIDQKWINNSPPSNNVNAANVFNQSPFGMSNFDNILQNGKSDFGNGQSWATANPFSSPQVMSNNPFL
ncbi:arf-GAP domain and FG repeat-containing protein 1-like [Ctenocephalides felis]|uniref:arf-GAP domain and FG repeat-containing protein 1-like n=1 Tax=Ctenocephalides felis TaxID=7515 RepID=UPI000E6E3326|nr:arf-GAP domain and FG repeat-containing protein 1-like [Ctenocephalides felis]